MSTPALVRRIRRRETHASRSVPAGVVAIVAVVALAWLVTETALAALGQAKLLLSPADMVDGIAGLPVVQAGLLVGAGVVLAVVGLVLVVLALKAGRLGRHTIEDDRAVVIVDDEVVGSSLVRTAADRSGTDPDRAVAAVSRSRARVTVTPSSGADIDREAVAAAVASTLADQGLKPGLTSRLIVARHGKVGA